MKQIVLIGLCSLMLVHCSQSDDWESLFNGKNLDGWHIYLKGTENYNGWYVENEILIFDPATRTEATNSDLVTDKQFTSFELSVEWMISEEGNSGIFWGVIEDSTYTHTYETGPEIQILDDNWSEYVKSRGDIQRAGSIFNISPPAKIATKPANEWNHNFIRIDHAKNEGLVMLNNEEIQRFPVNGKQWEELKANSAFKDWPGFGIAQKGHIALQDHGNQAAFRNIKIRELR